MYRSGHDGFGQLLGPTLVGSNLAFQRFIVPAGQTPASRPRTAHCPPKTKFVGWKDVCPPGMLCTQVGIPDCQPINDNGLGLGPEAPELSGGKRNVRGETLSEALTRMIAEKEARETPRFRSTLAPISVTVDPYTSPPPPPPVVGQRFPLWLLAIPVAIWAATQ